MRNISSNALAILTQQQGGEPLIYIQIAWTDSLALNYADKTIPEWGIAGKILNLSELENVVNYSGSGTSQSINVTLDDADGSIKAITNVNDIHKRPVKVFQWFTGIHINEAFIIFEGEVSSPITWKEGDRTISFEIISKLEDQEVGFSVEEGDFTGVPYELVGKAWPLPFGTCIKIPVLKIDPIPSGATTESTLVPDPTLGDQLSKLIKLIGEYGDMAILAFYTALNFYALAAQAPDSNVLDPDPQLHDQGDQYQAQGNQALHDQWKAQQDFSNLASQVASQKSGRKSQLGVAGGGCFPQNKQTNVKFGGTDHTGTFQGNTFVVNDSAHPGAQNGTSTQNYQQVDIEEAQLMGGQQTIQKLDYWWIDAGSPITVTDEMPVRYVVAMLPCTVLNVWSKKTYSGVQIDTQVPPSYYNVSLMPFGTIIATVVTLPRPLSHYQGEGWDDSIFVDVQSPIGPGTVDIITWLITTYTTLGIDAASFASVAVSLAPFPSNFCLFDRQNVVQLLTNIAYLARCSIWMKENVFFLKYMPAEPGYTDTITLEDDVCLNSLEVTHTTTEDLITKLIASYKTDYAQQKDNKIIIRNNLGKYGLQETTTDWFIYNTPTMVQLAATYWSIRKSNTWKLLNFRTPIHKLRIETFDTILINFSRNYCANGAVKGVVTSVKFDSAALEIQFQVWIPVRAGEMTVYPWAWPESTVNVYFGEAQFATPGEQASGDLTSSNGTCDQTLTVTPNKLKPRGSQNPGNREDEGGASAVEPRPDQHTDDPIDWDAKKQELSDNATIAEAEAKYGRPRRPSTAYRYRNYRATALPVLIVPGTFPGQIVEKKTGGMYKVKIYNKGLKAKAQTTQAKHLNAADVSDVQVNTWISVMVNVLEAKNVDGTRPPDRTLENTFVAGGGGSGGFPGQVVSGSGGTYTMAIYKKGTTGASENVTAKQLQIASEESIPAGAWTLVSEVTKPDGTKEYTMQFPVWME